MKTRTCSACGLEDLHVAVGLVELAPGQQGMVEVRLRVEVRHATATGDEAVEYVIAVPERFVAVARCRDKTACVARVRALS